MSCLLKVLSPGPRRRVRLSIARPDHPDGRVVRRGLQVTYLNGRADHAHARRGEQRDAEARGDELADAGRAVGLEFDARREALGRRRLDQNRVQPAARAQAYERLVADVGEPGWPGPG